MNPRKKKEESKPLSKDSFLIPTLSKVILAIALFYIFGWIIRPVTIFYTDWYPVGFPFTVRATGLCPPTFVCVEFRWMAFIINLALWYMFSAFIIHKRVKFFSFFLYFVILVLLTMCTNSLF